jgi:hypothetical protein
VTKTPNWRQIGNSGKSAENLPSLPESGATSRGELEGCKVCFGVRQVGFQILTWLPVSDLTLSKLRGLDSALC